jgi:hypothetical protein
MCELFFDNSLIALHSFSFALKIKDHSSLLSVRSIYKSDAPSSGDFCFEVKQSEAKFKSFFSFFAFFHFFSLFSLFFRFFSLNFRFTSIFSLNFRLFYLHFRFRFLVFHMEVNHVKSGFFFASKRNEIFASI